MPEPEALSNFKAFIAEIGEDMQRGMKLGADADLLSLANKMEQANQKADELELKRPYSDERIEKLRATHNRVAYYNQTGFDAPSLSET